MKVTYNEKGEPMVGKGVLFEKLARITGYLAPTNRWNSAKKEELNDRVKHETESMNGLHD